MLTALNTEKPAVAFCPVRSGPDIDWQQDLPWYLKHLVVVPRRFALSVDHEMLADRALGLDLAGQACYCCYRHVLTSLHSDDGEWLFEAADYAQVLSGWRLHDGRWLQATRVLNNFDTGNTRTWLLMCQQMPR